MPSSDQPTPEQPTGDHDDVIDVEVVERAEVVAPGQKRLVDGGGGRVFDAAGRLERVDSSAGSRRAGVGGDGELGKGCSVSVGQWLGRVFGGLALLALVFGFLWAGGFELDSAVQWARANPAVARAAMVAFITLMLPLLLPTGPVAIIPGYIWGEVEGLSLVLLGACLGGVLNMMITRRYVSGKIDQHVQASPTLAALRRAIDARGFRIALALRLSPVTPYALVSYMAGLTGMKYRSYALASLVGGVPWTLVYATAGALLAAQSKEVTLDAEVGPAGPWLRLVGLACTVVVAVWVGRAARRELAAARDALS